MNLEPGRNGINTRFTVDRQPVKRGRKKSLFGPLAKENDLSLDDVRKIYKNILTARGIDELNKVKEKYPTVLTDLTIEMLKKDMAGRLTGRKIEAIDPITKEKKERYELIKSYETIKYMLDRIFGIPAKVDLAISGSIDVGVADMSRDERREMIDDLLKEYRGGK